MPSLDKVHIGVAGVKLCAFRIVNLQADTPTGLGLAEMLANAVLCIAGVLGAGLRAKGECQQGTITGPNLH